MNVKSLVQRCVEVASQMDPTHLQILPPMLKDKILLYLMKCSTCTVEYLKVLLHKKTIKLDLTFCVIKEEDLLLLNNLTNLKYIYLPHPHILGKHGEYSEKALLKLFEDKRNLEVVVLRGHREVTDRVVKIIVENSPKLQVLNLDGTSISDNSLFYLKDCIDLLDLSISKTKVTDSGIEDLTSGDAIKTLRFIHMGQCPNLTSKCLTYLIVPDSNLCICKSDLAPRMKVGILYRLRKLYEDPSKSYV